MLDSARNYDELTLFQPNMAVAEFHTEAALHHKKHLVLVLVMMPNKLAFEFIELDQLPVEFTSDVRLPVLRNLSELLRNVYFFHEVSSTKKSRQLALTADS
jgi:hypothetical protein